MVYVDALNHQLNSDDKEVIRESWEKLKFSQSDLAKDIFTMICNQSPEMKIQFPWFETYAQPVEEAVTSDGFKKHATAFIEMLDRVIINLDNVPELRNITIRLAHVHSDIDRLQPYFWATFLECMLYQIREHLIKTKAYSTDHVMLDAVIMLWRSVLSGLLDDFQVAYFAQQGVSVPCGPTQTPEMGNDRHVKEQSDSSSKSSSSPLKNSITSRLKITKTQSAKRLMPSNVLNKLCANGIDKNDQDDNRSI